MLASRSRALPLSNDLYSPSLPSSSSFLKSFVFWARSLRWASESLWWATISVAAASSLEIVFERSISARPFSRWIHAEDEHDTYLAKRRSPSEIYSHSQPAAEVPGSQRQQARSLRDRKPPKWS